MLHTAKKGFTLIELLIVVVIIGILAAIAIPKFSNTKDKAKLASVKTDIRNYMTAEEAYFSDNSSYGSYTDLTSGNYDFALSPGNSQTATGATAGGYNLTVVNTSISKGIYGCTILAGDAAASDPTKDGVVDCDQTK
ncbi:MAG TPA: prepilin-type N-terminal cleavage/methylation domain-containing protein [Gemmatimonadaceae bacterium]|nr:prepilin-type N-terminal cleavage/methylation domain-containing protein [Gemmatimonadaceae bacterium]